MKGKVYLVGAGPGDPGLITWRGKEILENARVIVHDALVSPQLLLLAPRAVKINVGKKGGKISWKQERIHALLLRLAKQGGVIVRLKGGDPFIFGRAGEETLFLKKNRISFTVIPGVTAAAGAAASALIPLTHRHYASQLSFITAHETQDKEKSAIDWKNMDPRHSTIVFYMGVRALPGLVKKLLGQAGISKNTPVLIIQEATCPGEKIVEGRLSDILQKLKKVKLKSPSLIVVGEVLRFRRKLLSGKLKNRKVRIVVTRPGKQAEGMHKALENMGAEAVDFPVIEILPPASWKPVDEAIQSLKQYDWVVFTSANGVDYFMKRIFSGGRDARSLAHLQAACIGPATAERLAAYGIKADFMPRDYESRGIISALRKRTDLQGKKFLLARADLVTADLAAGIRKLGAQVKEITVYRITPLVHSRALAADLQRQMLAGDIDGVTFTSGSTVHNFVKNIGLPTIRKIKHPIRWLSIGPVTSQVLKQYRMTPVTQAKVYTQEGLAGAIRQAFKARLKLI